MTMTEEAPVQFKLNLPAGLKKRLEHEAIENRRSLSAEIIRRLEDSFDFGLPSFSLEELPADQRLKYIIEMANGLAGDLKDYARAVNAPEFERDLRASAFKASDPLPHKDEKLPINPKPTKKPKPSTDPLTAKRKLDI